MQAWLQESADVFLIESKAINILPMLLQFLFGGVYGFLHRYAVIKVHYIDAEENGPSGRG